MLRILIPVILTAAASAAEPLYSNNFETEEVGKLPKGMLAINGTFAVQLDNSNHVLELPGEPLDTFGVLFGPSQADGVSVAAKFLGSLKGRKFPTFGLSLNGAGGYRLQLAPAKKALELVKGDDVKSSVPYDWGSGAWTSLRLQVRKDAKGTWIIEGKAWPAASAEPAAWQITLDEPTAPAAGRAGLWGSPFSGTPIRFDDLLLEPSH